MSILAKNSINRPKMLKNGKKDLKIVNLVTICLSGRQFFVPLQTRYGGKSYAIFLIPQNYTSNLGKMPMMKKIHLLSLLILVFACSCNERPQVQLPAVSKLSIVSNVNSSGEVWCDLADPSGKSFAIRSVSTRIGVDNNIFEQGDQIGLYVAEWAGRDAASQAKTNLDSIGNQTDNHLFSYVTLPTNGWTSSVLTNPLTWRKVSVFAYHPYVASVANALQLPFAVREDQTGGILTTDYLMWGKGATNDAGYTPATDATPMVLNFDHKTAYVDLSVTLPSIFNGLSFASIDAAYVLGVPVEGNKLNLNDGVLTVSTAAADLKPVKMFKAAGTGNNLVGDFSAVITPTVIAAGKEIIKIDYTTAGAVKGSLYFYAGASGFKFDANNRYTITLKTSEFGFSSDLPEFTGDLETSTQLFIVRSTGTEEWTLTSGDPSWIQVALNDVTPVWANSVKATGEKTCRIKVLKNSTGLSRMNKLTLSATGKTSVELLVFQKKNTI